jgi:hypothetical protein
MTAITLVRPSWHWQSIFVQSNRRAGEVNKKGEIEIALVKSTIVSKWKKKKIPRKKRIIEEEFSQARSAA